MIVWLKSFSTFDLPHKTGCFTFCFVNLLNLSYNLSEISKSLRMGNSNKKV